MHKIFGDIFEVGGCAVGAGTTTPPRGLIAGGKCVGLRAALPLARVRERDRVGLLARAANKRKGIN